MQTVLGTIFQIQRWSVNDGEGIRSTVFLKGCPLRCQWCANPESWHAVPEVLYLPERCTGCGRCISACPAGILSLDAASGKVISSGVCEGCGRCSAVCPTGARKVIGSRVTVDEVMKVVQRDAVFYRESGGGVTFSGGEPFAQPEFLRQLVLACNRLGFDTAVETCGFYDFDPVRDIFERLDSVFIDIKHMDDAVHRRWTGVGNRLILANVEKISCLNPNTIVRVPLIGEVNANEANIRAMCEFLCQKTQVKGVELLPYHDFGKSKQHAAGMADQVFTTPDAVVVEHFEQLIAGYGIKIFHFR